MNDVRRGFIALTSVLILSAALLTMAVGAGGVSVYARLNGLGREYKTQGRFIAQSCIGYVRLALEKDTDYAGDENKNISGGTCVISELNSKSGIVTATYKNAVTTYVFSLDSGNNLESEKEIPNAP
jgi:hypothetical protein